MKCAFIKKNGQACNSNAQTGKEFCYLHDPGISEEEKKAAQAKGGHNRSLTIQAPLEPLSLNIPQDVVLLFADTINRVRSGQMDVRVANCLGSLGNYLLKGMEISDIARRVELLEEKTTANFTNL